MYPPTKYILSAIELLSAKFAILELDGLEI